MLDRPMPDAVFKTRVRDESIGGDILAWLQGNRR
jgi:hypothetical protein